MALLSAEAASAPGGLCLHAGPMLELGSPARTPELSLCVLLLVLGPEEQGSLEPGLLTVALVVGLAPLLESRSPRLGPGGGQSPSAPPQGAAVCSRSSGAGGTCLPQGHIPWQACQTPQALSCSCWAPDGAEATGRATLPIGLLSEPPGRAACGSLCERPSGRSSAALLAVVYAAVRGLCCKTAVQGGMTCVLPRLCLQALCPLCTRRLHLGACRTPGDTVPTLHYS